MSFFATLQEVSILAGGISASQVSNMRAAMLADGAIQDSEAEFLFSLKETFKGRENAPEWAAFWAEAILMFVRNQDNSINANRLAWIQTRIAENGIDEIEQQFLNTLSA